MSQDRAGADGSEIIGPDEGEPDASDEFDDPLDRLQREAEDAPSNVQESDEVAPGEGSGDEAPTG